MWIECLRVAIPCHSEAFGICDNESMKPKAFTDGSRGTAREIIFDLIMSWRRRFERLSINFTLDARKHQGRRDHSWLNNRHLGVS